MKVNNALYTYPVLSNSGLRDDYTGASNFSISLEKEQTGSTEVSLEIIVDLLDANLQKLVNDALAKVVCHIESPLSSYRRIIEVTPFDMRTMVAVNPKTMRGTLEVSAFIVATSDINNFTSSTFGEFYVGSYKIERGDVLAFAPTIEVEIEPDDIDKRPTQSIIKVRQNDKREMTIDFTGEYIVIYLPKNTYAGYKIISLKDSIHYKLSLMAIVLPALMDAIYEIKSGDGSYDDKTWSRVIRAKLKTGGRGTDTSHYDPLAHAQFLLNNPADDTFVPIIEQLYGGNE